jgi:hypothetical protein
VSYFEVLVEGASDVPTVREVLVRRFGLVERQDFRIHPHKGRGSLPANPLARPDPRHQGLLHQLPAKLQGFGRYMGNEACVLVVVDVDDTPCQQLLAELQTMLARLPSRPPNVLFRLAIEETESWFIADAQAVGAAYPKARLQRLRAFAPDTVCGAWEVLAAALGYKPDDVTGSDKSAWAKAIAPNLNLMTPASPSLGKLLQGIDRELSRAAAFRNGSGSAAPGTGPS